MPRHTSGHDFLTNQRLQDAVIEAVKLGVPPHSAMLNVGISRDMLYQYRQALRTEKWAGRGGIKPETKEALVEFMERLEHAITEFEEKCVRRLEEEANSINERTGVRDWRATAWLLEHNQGTRARWAPWREQTIKMEMAELIAHPVFKEVQARSEEELLEGIGDPEWLRLLGAPKDESAP